MDLQKHVGRSRSLSVVFAALALLVAVAALFSAQFSQVAAQDDSTPTTSNEPEHTLSVSGIGTVNVDPDTALVSLGALSRSEELTTSQNDVNVRLADITASLTGNGVAEEDITTSNYNIYPIPEYDNDGNYVGISGYEVSASLSVKVRDLETVGKVLDDAVSAGANQVWGISFYREDTAGPASQARQAAIEDARAKADEMAAAAGVEIVGVQSISEFSSPAPAPVMYDMAAGRGGADMEAAVSEAPISTGQSTIQVEVSIVYIIADAPDSEDTN